MFEKVNPTHPDKIADRIAGALVDYAYTQEENPKVAIEVLLGHHDCMIIAESSVKFPYIVYKPIVDRLAGLNYSIYLRYVQQDPILARNQEFELRCGDNGIFKGVPISEEELKLTNIAYDIYSQYPTDGKYILDNNKLIICQSHINQLEKETLIDKYRSEYQIILNPLGFWTGGLDVDSGATNRKLGSDMGASITGGGLHGKDLSKADVSINIYCWLKAQQTHSTIEYSCAIGDKIVDNIPYTQIVQIAKEYIHDIGGFEKFAEWGLIRPDSLKI